MDYHNVYADTARDILSKPFKTKRHVCHELEIDEKTYDNWVSDHEDFEQAVTLGFIEGEVKTRTLLAQAAIMPPHKVNVKVLLTLAIDVYGIGIVQEQGEDEPVRWEINVVKSGSGHTGEAIPATDEEKAV